MPLDHLLPPVNPGFFRNAVPWVKNAAVRSGTRRKYHCSSMHPALLALVSPTFGHCIGEPIHNCRIEFGGSIRVLGRQCPLLHFSFRGPGAGVFIALESARLSAFPGLSNRGSEFMDASLREILGCVSVSGRLIWE